MGVRAYELCAHEMLCVRRDRASAAGCATTRATTTTRNTTPTAIHAGMCICILMLIGDMQLKHHSISFSVGLLSFDLLVHSGIHCRQALL